MKYAMPHKSIFFTRIAIVILAFATFACAATDPYESISVGDSREKVVGILGNPVNPVKDLTVTERETIISTLKQTHNKNSESFTIWKRDSNFYYIVGFNKKDTVAVKHRLLNLVQ